ncbi:MAG: glycosyltransferase family 39 protein, partial [Desulfarculaceae bacterium]
AALFLLAAAVRVLFLFHPVVDSDVAVVGLMGMHALEGEFSPLYWGQHYGGSQESLVAAFLFWISGVSRYALNGAAALISLVYLAGLYRLGKELLGRSAGLVALGLAAVGPFFLVWYSVQARGINIEVLTAGTWLLAFTARALRLEPGTGPYLWQCLGIGLMAGLGFWAHVLMVYFLVPAGLLLWRHDPRLLLKPRFALMLVGFIAGAWPLLYYNLTHDWATYHLLFTPQGPAVGFGESLAFFIRQSLPVLTGLRYPGEGVWVQPVLSVLVGLISAGALIWALGAGGKDLIYRLKGLPAKRGMDLILLILVSVTVVFCWLGGASSKSSRYLLSLYAVWPLVLAFGFKRLREQALRRGYKSLSLATWSLLVLIGGFYLLGTVASTHLFLPHEKARHQIAWERNLEWVDFFKSKGISHVYMDYYWYSTRATFDAKQEVVFLLPQEERYPGFQQGLLRARKAGFLYRSANAPGLLQSLTSMGARYQTRNLAGNMTAIYDLHPPSGQPLILQDQGFQGEGFPSSEDVAQAWDLNATTRWFSLGPQRPGQWLQLDLGRIENQVCQLLLFFGVHQDKPKALVVEGSQDGWQWVELARRKDEARVWIWAADKPISLFKTPWQEIRFTPRPLRYLRLRQTGTSTNYYWSLNEILVGTQTAAPQVPPDPKAASAWLAREIRDDGPVWCGPALNAWLPKRLQAHPRRQSRPSWMREYLRPELLMPLDKEMLLALPLGLAGASQQVLSSCGYEYSVQKRHGYALIRARAARLSSEGTKYLNQVRPQQTPHGLALDLGEEKTINQVVLRGDRDSFVTPAGLHLEAGARDGDYQKVSFKALWPPQLYWAGIMPLAASPYPLRLKFAAIKVRYLRLTKTIPPAGRLPGILTLDVFGPKGAQP